MIWCLALTAFCSEEWTIQTDSFVPLGSYQVALSDRGDLYVLNREKSRIEIYSDAGRMIGHFGSKGEGPGSFIRPQYIYLHRDKVYLRHDFSKYSVFDLNGRFLSQERDVDFSKLGFYLESTRTILDWTHQDPGHFRWRFLERNGDDWTSRIVLEGTWDAGNMGQRFQFDPTYRTPFLVGHPRGHKAVLVGLGHPPKLWQIDMESGRIERVVCPKFPMIPFNEEWGRAQLEATDSGRSDTDITYAPPEIFPAVKRIWFAPDDHLVVEPWTGFPDRQRKFRAINLAGGQSTLGFEPSLITRVSAWTEHEVVFCSIDSESDETALLVRAEWDRFGDLCKTYPFAFDVSRKQHFVTF